MRVGTNYISAMTTSLEQFMSITIGSIRFIDASPFMKESLSQPGEKLFDKSGKYINFRHVKEFYDEHLSLLCQKG